MLRTHTPHAFSISTSPLSADLAFASCVPEKVMEFTRCSRSVTRAVYSDKVERSSWCDNKFSLTSICRRRMASVSP